MVFTPNDLFSENLRTPMNVSSGLVPLRVQSCPRTRHTEVSTPFIVPWEGLHPVVKKTFISSKLKPWIEARRRFRLSHAQVQMARELGMNPKKFGGMANHDQEPWKLPLPEFIEQCYEKQFHRKSPLDVRSVEEKDAEKRARKQARRAEPRADPSDVDT
jgi:hypothetical protein